MSPHGVPAMLAPMDGRVPVILCVDVEPDDHVYAPEDPSPWRGFELLAERMEELRGTLGDITGETARFSWFLRMDPQIELAYGDPAFIVDRHRTIFDRTLARGDALGVHPHAWRWDRDRRVWIGDHGDPAWVEACVDMSFEAYRSRFGEPARIHRFGSRFLSEAVLAAARGHGAVVDMTVEPGEPSDGPGSRMGGEWTGRTPDFVDAPRVPYRPDPADLQRVSPSTEGLWAIPLTSGRLVLHPRRVRRAARAARHPARAVRSLARRASAGGDGHRPHRLLAMWRDWRSPRDFWRAAFDATEAGDPAYLAFAIRSDTPVHRNLRERFEGIMAALPHHPEADRLVFTTPEDALRRMGLRA